MKKITLLTLSLSLLLHLILSCSKSNSCTICQKGVFPGLAQYELCDDGWREYGDGLWQTNQRNVYSQRFSPGENREQAVNKVKALGFSCN